MYSELMLPPANPSRDTTFLADPLGTDASEIGRWLRDLLGGLPGDIAMARQAATAVKRFAEAPTTLVDDFAKRVALRLNRDEPVTAGNRGDVLAIALYECAAEAVAEGHVPEAGIGLVALLAWLETRPQSLLGLAICAARLNLFDDALDLALESRVNGNRHPRADLVAGLAELERGNLRAARLCLARSSRIARREPSHGEDLRRAQRLLLLMHMHNAKGLRRSLGEN